MEKIGAFLRIFFGCHALHGRSFFWRGRQFPICARCTGELIGMIGGGFLYGILGWYPSWGWCIVFALPLIIDGTIQMKTTWLSNNPLRCITGIFFGIAFLSLLLRFHFFAVEIAKRIVFG